MSPQLQAEHNLSLNPDPNPNPNTDPNRNRNPNPDPNPNPNPDPNPNPTPNQAEHNLFDFRHVAPLLSKATLHAPGACVLFATPGMLTAGLALEAFKVRAGTRVLTLTLPLPLTLTLTLALTLTLTLTRCGRVIRATWCWSLATVYRARLAPRCSLAPSRSRWRAAPCPCAAR
eukprot:scaffold11701_cov56-Phaeocystis_antarctica.AAC.4